LLNCWQLLPSLRRHSAASGPAVQRPVPHLYGPLSPSPAWRAGPFFQSFGS
jgi:hypothetical protein